MTSHPQPPTEPFSLVSPNPTAGHLPPTEKPAAEKFLRDCTQDGEAQLPLASTAMLHMPLQQRASVLASGQVRGCNAVCPNAKSRHAVPLP